MKTRGCRNRSGQFARCGTRAPVGVPAGRRVSKSFPTAPTLQTHLGVSLAQARAIREAILNATNPKSALEAAGRLMEATGKRNLMFFGVEYIERDASEGVKRSFYYTNTGDSYSPIIAYFPSLGAFRAYGGGWASAAGLDN